MIVLLLPGLPLMMVLLTYVVAKKIEGAHLKALRERERATLHRPATTEKRPDTARTIVHGELATGSVVVSIDPFSMFLVALHNVFGGEILCLERLVDRGRREATLRMKESCPDADMFINLHYETSVLATVSEGKQNLAGVEVLASSTAIQFGGEKHRDVGVINSEMPVLRKVPEADHYGL